MLSIELLESKGCKTSEGLNRCLNNKDFYLMLVSKSLKDDSFENFLGGDLNRTCVQQQ